jgi:predicted HicB family RNase H-like nuclease
MRVQVHERVDETTVLCKVSWNPPSSTSSIQFIVRVPATLHEFSVEAGAEIMPAALRSMALLKARDAADAFSNLVNESL